LLASDNPEDWDRARDDYLDKIERWHPGAYAAEIAAERQRILDHRELRRAVNAGANLEVKSEAERLYRRGLALAQNGDLSSAKAYWTALAKAFSASEADRRWRSLAEIGVAEVERAMEKDRPAFPDAKASVVSILDAVKKMREEGKNDAADQIISALHSLYGDNPEILAMLK
jgi:hypothetical protein